MSTNCVGCGKVCAGQPHAMSTKCTGLHTPWYAGAQRVCGPEPTPCHHCPALLSGFDGSHAFAARQTARVYASIDVHRPADFWGRPRRRLPATSSTVQHHCGYCSNESSWNIAHQDSARSLAQGSAIWWALLTVMPSTKDKVTCARKRHCGDTTVEEFSCSVDEAADVAYIAEWRFDAF
jgi:hypothetical protein